MLAGRDVIVISSIEWNFLWQGPQEIASRLARDGNRVLYVENTGVRSPRLSDAGRVASRLMRWAGAFSSHGLQTVSPNLHICSPVVLPPFGRPWQREINRRLFLPVVRRAAASLSMRDVVILTFLPTDTAVDLIKLLRTDAGAVVYYCVADFAELSSNPSRLSQSERQLVGMSDLVLAQCSALATHCSQWADNIHIIPYGVNLEVFTRSNGSGPTPKVINKKAMGSNVVPDLPRPVIGYVGGLHRYVDLTLLTSMAQTRPHWSWVFIGPAQTTLGKFASLPNVHVLGEFQHQELAGQIERFDVGIVPYVSSAFTDTVVPTKINEYLAMGKPVVSTALPALSDNYHWPGVVISCEPEHDSFIAAIEEALRLPTDETAQARRREVAGHSDWPARLKLICDLIDEALSEKSGLTRSKPRIKGAHA
jgi:glycosyltransferase involved in cell wall biosynthesis